MIRIASNLSLPDDTVTQTIGVLAKRRAGKSYFARRLAEQFFRSGLQVVIIDPKGDQWGIRSAADGRGPGLPIIILGGEHGDIPKLETSSGEVVAKMIVEERVSALLDLSFFRKHEVATFMTGFMENLYRLKAKEQFRTPVMLIVDEADAIAPQRPQKGEERMLGAAEDIVRRGGQRGIGCTLVTQRSAVLNKNVLTQTQILVVLRTIAPQDLAAMEAWIEVHGNKRERDILMSSLPALPVGDAFVWSPGWPDANGIFTRVHVLPIETFDSGSTPKVGERPAAPKHMADVDLDALKRQMAGTIERAKAEDPRELRKKIAELEKLLAAKPTVEKPKPMLTDEQHRRLDGFFEVAGQLNRNYEEVLKLMKPQETILRELHGAIGVLHAQAFGDLPVQGMEPFHAKVQIHRTNVPLRGEVPKGKYKVRAPNNGSGEVGSGGLKRILTALAQRPNGLSAKQVGVRAGMSSKSGTFGTYLARARAAGWVHGDRNHLSITEDGTEALGAYEPLPLGPDLLQYWLNVLGDSGIAKMLYELARAYPATLDKEELGRRAGMTQSGTFGTYLARLHSLELVEKVDGEIRASGELF